MSLLKAQDDADAVRECLAGNSEAFGVLVKKYQQPIYNLALRMLREPEDAMDVSQTVFIKAFEKLDSYNPAHRFFSWIYRIAINESINFSKRSKRLDEYESGVSASEEMTPEDRYRDEALEEEVSAAISLLTMDYRTVIVLKHYNDLSYQEMAEVLDIPEKTVKSRLFSARQRLKDILQKRGIGR